MPIERPPSTDPGTGQCHPLAPSPGPFSRLLLPGPSPGPFSRPLLERGGAGPTVAASGPPLGSSSRPLAPSRSIDGLSETVSGLSGGVGGASRSAGGRATRGTRGRRRRMAPAGPGEDGGGIGPIPGSRRRVEAGGRNGPRGRRGDAGVSGVFETCLSLSTKGDECLWERVLRCRRLRDDGSLRSEAIRGAGFRRFVGRAGGDGGRCPPYKRQRHGRTHPRIASH
jgi:hypothetical protein